MEQKYITYNILGGVISIVISCVVNMFYTSYITGKVGIEAYGFVALGNNFITYIDLVVSAINIYATRFIALEYHKGNLQKTNVYFNSILAANILMAFVLLIPGIILVLHIDALISIPLNLISDVKLLFALVLINYLITLIGTAYNCATFIKNKLYKTSICKAISILLKAVFVCYLLLAFTIHVWYISLAAITASIFVLITNITFTSILTPELKENKNNFSINAIKDLFFSGIWNSFASLGTTLNGGLDLIITNIFINATSMGIISIPKTLSNITAQFLMEITNAFRPSQMKCYAAQDQDMLVKNLINSMKICGLACCIIFAVFFTYGKLFLDLWIPTQNTQLIYELSVLTFVSDVLVGTTRPLNYIMVLTKKLKFPCLMNLLIGFLNVICMIVLLRHSNMGLYAVAITTVIGNVIYQMVVMPQYAVKVIQIKGHSFYRIIFKYLLTTVGITIVLRTISIYLNFEGWIGLIVNSLISSLIGIFLYVFCMYSRKECLMVVKRIFSVSIINKIGRRR